MRAFMFLLLYIPTTALCVNNNTLNYHSKGTQASDLTSNEAKNLEHLKPKKEWCYILLSILKEIIDDLPELGAGVGVAIGLERLTSFILEQASKLNGSVYIDTTGQAMINAWVIIPALIVDILYTITKNIIQHRSTNRAMERKLHTKLRLSLLTLTTLKSQEACLHLTQATDQLVTYLFSLTSKLNLGAFISASFLGAGTHLLPIAHYPKKIFTKTESLRRRATPPRLINNIVALCQLMAVITVVVVSVSSLGNGTAAKTSIEDTVRSSALHIVGIAGGCLTVSAVKVTQKIVSLCKNLFYKVVKKTSDFCLGCWFEKKTGEGSATIEEIVIEAT